MCDPRRLLAVAALVAAAASPVLAAECKSSSRVIDSSWYNKGSCLVKFSSVPAASQKTYSEGVTVHVWIRRNDFRKSPRLEILSHPKVTVKPTLMISRTGHCPRKSPKGGRIEICCNVTWEEPFDLVELVYHFESVYARKEISVVYRTKSRNCSGKYTVEAPVPRFTLAVNPSTKSFNVTVQSDKTVKALWCYRSDANCMVDDDVTPVAIDPSESPWALLSFPYFLPCVCVQVFHTYTDSPRERKCPFEDQNLDDAADVWLSSEVDLFNTHFTWRPKCPSSILSVSAALCWKLSEQLCVVAPNSTLTATGTKTLNYNTSTLDTHPQMCVQFSTHGSRNTSCPFSSPTWEVTVTTGRRSLVLHLTSVFPATFSAQLCDPDEQGCSPRGEIHSVTLVPTASSVTLPVHFHEAPLCVQVWRSDPPLYGRRVLCVDNTRGRYALYIVVAWTLAAAGCLLGSFVYHQVKSGLATWLYIHKPVLLVSSSERTGHVAATCALASMLERELSATVHTPLWASTSRSGGGVADVGPLPWLYGQWEAVRDSQGKVLIVWSPEAKAAYEKRRKETLAEDDKAKKTKAEVKRHGEKSKVRSCNERRGGDGPPETERPHVVAPAFAAALACLEGALRQGKGQEVAVVYFQGLCHSRDVPRALRRLPRYCLPQDFRGLIQELGGMRQPTASDESSCCCCWRCWPRLLSKALSVKLAQRLAARLERLLRRSKEDAHEPLRPSPRTAEES